MVQLVLNVPDILAEDPSSLVEGFTNGQFIVLPAQKRLTIAEAAAQIRRTYDDTLKLIKKANIRTFSQELTGEPMIQAVSLSKLIEEERADQLRNYEEYLKEAEALGALR